MLGPLAASFILDAGWGFDAVFVLCAIAAALALMIYGLIYIKYRHISVAGSH